MSNVQFSGGGFEKVNCDGVITFKSLQTGFLTDDPLLWENSSCHPSISTF
jgi:hypothetical protein